MINTVKQKWDKILSNESLYIYGAKKTAVRLFNMIEAYGYRNHVKGFLVTERKDNPTSIEGLPVLEVGRLKDRRVRILIPHLGTYKKEILELLDKLQYQDTVLVGNLIIQTDEENKEKNNFEEIGMDDYQRKTVEEKKSDQEICNKIRSILSKEKPDFGVIRPYQSMELIGLKGERPTTYRIEKYGLKEILKPNMDILDIGCNSAFMDMAIANLVKSVTGIEYDASLVEIAQMVKNYLHIVNSHVIHSNFDDWFEKNHENKYDVVFSFAIHHWLDLNPAEYVSRLDELLNDNGFLCIESHTYGDSGYLECVYHMLNRGYVIIKEDTIKDDGVHTRKFAIIQKK